MSGDNLMCLDMDNLLMKTLFIRIVTFYREGVSSIGAPLASFQDGRHGPKMAAMTQDGRHGSKMVAITSRDKPMTRSGCAMTFLRCPGVEVVVEVRWW